VYVRGLKGDEERIQRTRHGHTLEEPYAVRINGGHRSITTINIRRHRDMVAVALICVILIATQ
jgi:hypothetical protein